MPKKLNHAGDLQNYVPEGHPAGGQYGDNETGSNVNFRQKKIEDGFKKGFEAKKPEEPKKKPETPSVQVTATKEKGQNDIASEIEKSRLDDTLKKEFKEAWDTGNETSRKIIENIPQKVVCKFNNKGKSYFVPSTGSESVTVAKNAFTLTEARSTQSTMFHEFGHAVDHLYSTGETKTIYDYGFFKSETKSKNMLSYDYVTSSGKTLNETLKGEFDEKVRKKLLADYKKEYNGADSYSEQLKIREKYANLSDMYEAQVSKGKGFSGWGHGRPYWKSDDKLQATEFFADAFSAKSMKNQEQYELIKKYLPNTCKAFEEIYDKVAKDPKGIKMENKERTIRK